MVHLKNFSLEYPNIQIGDVLKAIEMAIPAFVIEQAIANTQTEELTGFLNKESGFIRRPEEYQDAEVRQNRSGDSY